MLTKLIVVVALAGAVYWASLAVASGETSQTQEQRIAALENQLEWAQKELFERTDAIGEQANDADYRSDVNWARIDALLGLAQ